MTSDKFALNDRTVGFDECDNAFFPPNPIGTMDLLGNLHKKEDFDWTYEGNPRGAALEYEKQRDYGYSHLLSQLRLIGKLEDPESVEEMLNAE